MNEILTIKKQKKAVEGLFTCDLDLHIAKAMADFKWTGPKISQQLWWEICSFFEWTYATTKSESQVRLFVNGVTQQWGAWAFPQRKGTGMTTTELPDHERWAEGALKFPGPDWYYWGTVHHHCSMGAFQSGTDEANEKEIEGLHITVGKIGSLRYDIDCRLYQMKWKLTPDMSQFWDVGPTVKMQVPDELHPTVALYQMCTPPPRDWQFPVPWQENYLIPPPPVIITSAPTTVVPHWSDNHPTTSQSRMFVNDDQRLPSDLKFDKERASEQLYAWLHGPDADPGHTINFAIETLQAFAQDKMFTEMARLMWLHDVSPDALLDQFEIYVEEMELRKELQEEAKAAQQEQANQLSQQNGEGSPHNGDEYPFHMS